MHQRGRLEGLSGGNAGQPACREPSQIVIDQRQQLVRRVHATTRVVRIGLIVKYALPDAYLSVVEALKHGGRTDRDDG